MARPKLSDLEKAVRLRDRLSDKIEQMRQRVSEDPNGPSREPSVGRPPVPYSVQLERLERQYDEALQRIEQLRTDSENANIETHQIANVDEVAYCRISPLHLAEVYEDNIKPVGRPSNHSVQTLEYKIRQFEQRIIRITEGKEAPKSSVAQGSNGKKLGRRPQGTSIKIQRIQEKIENLRREVEEIEATMSSRELEDLAIRRLSHQASGLKKQIRKQQQLDTLSDVSSNDADSQVSTLEMIEQYDQLCREIQQRRNALKGIEEILVDTSSFRSF